MLKVTTIVRGRPLRHFNPLRVRSASTALAVSLKSPSPSIPTTDVSQNLPPNIRIKNILQSLRYLVCETDVVDVSQKELWKARIDGAIRNLSLDSRKPTIACELQPSVLFSNFWTFILTLSLFISVWGSAQEAMRDVVTTLLDDPLASDATRPTRLYNRHPSKEVSLQTKFVIRWVLSGFANFFEPISHFFAEILLI
jgi:hypothetical protein